MKLGYWYISEETYGDSRNISGTASVVRMNGPMCDAVIVSLGATAAECKAVAQLLLLAPDALEALAEICELPADDYGERTIPAGFLDKARNVLRKVPAQEEA